MLLGAGYSQCDANGDGNLNILDLVVSSNCIINDCWEIPEPSGEIYGYWMADSFSISMNGIPMETIYCGEFNDEEYEQGAALVINFNEDYSGEEWNIDASFCGTNEVDLSNPSYYGSWFYSIYGDTLTLIYLDDYGNEEPIVFTIETLNENRLVLYVDDNDDYSQEITFDFHRVSVTSDSLNTFNNGQSIFNHNTLISLLKRNSH